MATVTKRNGYYGELLKCYLGCSGTFIKTRCGEKSAPTFCHAIKSACATAIESKHQQYALVRYPFRDV